MWGKILIIQMVLMCDFIWEQYLKENCLIKSCYPKKKPNNKKPHNNKALLNHTHTKVDVQVSKRVFSLFCFCSTVYFFFFGVFLMRLFGWSHIWPSPRDLSSFNPVSFSFPILLVCPLALLLLVGNNLTPRKCRLRRREGSKAQIFTKLMEHTLNKNL